LETKTDDIIVNNNFKAVTAHRQCNVAFSYEDTDLIKYFQFNKQFTENSGKIYQDN